MPIYEVEVYRTSKSFVYVEAEDESDAREAAEELLWSANDFNIEDEDYIIGEVPLDQVRGKYWSGGENGDWVDA